MRMEPFGVVEEQAGALVGGHAAGKAEGQHVRVELDAGALLSRSRRGASGQADGSLR